jgi:hypothetical protein
MLGSLNHGQVLTEAFSSHTRPAPTQTCLRRQTSISLLTRLGPAARGKGISRQLPKSGTSRHPSDATWCSDVAESRAAEPASETRSCLI